MDTNMVLNAGFNELVFENRHKEYGAYQIRKRYRKNVMFSVLIASVTFTSLLLLYMINLPSAVASGPPKPEGKVTIIPLTVDPPKHPVDPPVPPRINPAPKGSTSQVTSNIVITMDSVKPTLPNDSAYGNRKGVVDGRGPVNDTTQGKPCLTCDSTPGTPPVPKRLTWLPEPPKDPGLDEFFRKNIHYPQMAKEGNIEGTVWLSFVVDTRGDVKEIKIAKGVHPLLDKEVLRVAAFMPKWEPITDHGEPVEFVFNKPVRFVLSK